MTIWSPSGPDGRQASFDNSASCEQAPGCNPKLSKPPRAVQSSPEFSRSAPELLPEPRPMPSKASPGPTQSPSRASPIRPEQSRTDFRASEHLPEQSRAAQSPPRTSHNMQKQIGIVYVEQPSRAGQSHPDSSSARGLQNNPELSSNGVAMGPSLYV